MLRWRIFDFVGVLFPACMKELVLDSLLSTASDQKRALEEAQ